MIKVKELIKLKGGSVWHAVPMTSMRAAIHLMTEKKIGALPVLNEDGLVGIISERDILRTMANKGEQCPPLLAMVLKISRSEMMPTRPSSFKTGKAPIFFSVIKWMAARILVIGTACHTEPPFNLINSFTFIILLSLQ